jgi:hypothetical protein
MKYDESETTKELVTFESQPGNRKETGYQVPREHHGQCTYDFFTESRTVMI